MLPELNIQRLRAWTRQSFYAFAAFMHSLRDGNNLYAEKTFYPRCRWFQDAVHEGWSRLSSTDPRNHVKTTDLIYWMWWIALQQPDERYDSPEEFERATAFMAARPWMRGPNTRIRWVGISKEVAVLQVERAASYAASDPLFRTIWPEVCPENFAYTNSYGVKVKRVWNSEEIVLPTRTITGLAEPFLSAAGIDSQSTTLHFDIIIFDDPVTEATWKYQKLIQSSIDWLWLMPSLLEVADSNMPNASLALVNGNYWTYNDVQTHVRDNLQGYRYWYRKCWTCRVCGYDNCVRGPNCAPTDTPLWPERWTRDGLLREKSQNKQVFCAQYENDPVAGESVAFKPDRIRDCCFDAVTNEIVVYKPGSVSAIEKRVPVNACRGVISFDPATSTDERSCRTAIGVMAEDRETQAVYFIDLFADRVEPDAAIDALIDLYVKWRKIGLPIAHVGFETVAGQKYILPALISQARVRNVVNLQQKPTNQPTDLIQFYRTDRNVVKEERITNLLGWRINAGLLYIATNLPNRTLTDTELAQHPIGKSNDVIDQLAYAEQIYARMMFRKGVAEEIRNNVIARQRALHGVIY